MDGLAGGLEHGSAETWQTGLTAEERRESLDTALRLSALSAVRTKQPFSLEARVRGTAPTSTPRRASPAPCRPPAPGLACRLPCRRRSWPPRRPACRRERLSGRGPPSPPPP